MDFFIKMKKGSYFRDEDFGSGFVHHMKRIKRESRDPINAEIRELSP